MVAASLLLILALSGIPSKLNSRTPQASGEPPFVVAPEPWPVDGLGHHRAVVQVDAVADAVRVHLPWRRRDREPEKKAVLVYDGTAKTQVKDAFVARMDAESGDVVFRPRSAHAIYWIYYLPYRFQLENGGANGNYIAPAATADPVWESAARANWRDLPQAKLVRFEARTAFDSFAPMELPATRAEMEAFLSAHPDPYFVFSENREYPIRMPEAIPIRWVQAGPERELAGTARPNEYFAFQLGLFAARQAIEDVRVEFSDLSSPYGAKVPASKLACFNLGGVNWDGTPLSKRVDVPEGTVQALWCGLDLDAGTLKGIYTGKAVVTAKNAPSKTIALRIKVDGKPLADRGDSETWRYSRLRWLNSTLGTSEEPTPPYTPVGRQQQTLRVLGREVELGGAGLLHKIKAGDTQVLRSPMKLMVNGQLGGLSSKEPPLTFGKATKGRIPWTARCGAGGVPVSVEGALEFDGHVSLRITLKARDDAALENVEIVLPFTPDASELFMGIGRGGGFTPESFEWRWTGAYDSFWIGGVHAGLHVELRGGSYHGPMLNLFHPAPPDSWSSGGKGGVRIVKGPKGAEARLFTGPKTLKAGEELRLDLGLLITPVKPIDTAWQFKTRFYHNPFEYAPKPAAIQAGANVVNVHHANDINPYINYPFVAVKGMKAFVDGQHRAGRKVKIYDTIRELTNYTTELWALRSFGDEVFTNGGGGGFAWLQEHLVTGYIPSWYQPYPETGTADASIVTAGFSRWINYYVEGLAWLAKNVGIDGLYLDDVTFDRRVLMRMRRVLAMGGREPMMDLHSNTGFSIGPVNQYAEFFPFVDRIWFGESFNYDAMPPEQWLVEVSGIPFGLMGEMLQGGGNKWLGMVYGMSTRYGWTSENITRNPDKIWRFWDRFGIDKARMIGYWEGDCPVQVEGDPNVKATAYVRKGQTLLALGNFGAAAAEVRLTLDWRALGLSQPRSRLSAPAIEDFQGGREFGWGEPIRIEPKRGWLIVVGD